MTGRFATARDAAATPPADPKPTVAAAASEAPLRAEGLVGVYAHRVLDRGGDLRAVAADARAARFGAPAPAPDRLVRSGRPLPALAVGRGTERHRRALQAMPPEAARTNRAAPGRSPRPSRRLVGAGLAALVMFPLGALLARAVEPAHSVATLGSAPAETERVVSAAAAGDIDVSLSGIAPVAP